MTDKKQKLLQTAGRAREQAPASGKGGGFISLHQLEGGKLNLSDMDYCVRFGQPAHFAELRKVIAAERDKLPGYSYWKCENPACQWKAKMNGDKKESFPCLRCNTARYKDGSWMKQMSKKEAEAFDKAEDEKFIRDVETLGRIQLGGINEGRVKMGLAAMSWEEFKAAEKAELERRAQLSKVKA